MGVDKEKRANAMVGLLGLGLGAGFGVKEIVSDEILYNMFVMFIKKLVLTVQSAINYLKVLCVLF